MPFEKRFQEIIKKISVPSELVLWRDMSIFGFFIFIVVCLYLLFELDTFNLRLINKATANTSVLLIGLSFGLSGICYFWNFFDRKIIYRKHLGLVGFIYGLIHTFISFFLIPPQFRNYLSSQNIVSFLFAVGGLLVFFVMALISNRYAVQELGGRLWRMILRFGYIAYIFILFHFALRAFYGWQKWFTQEALALPPLSLLVANYIVSILLLRLALEIDVRRKKQSKGLAYRV